MHIKPALTIHRDDAEDLITALDDFFEEHEDASMDVIETGYIKSSGNYRLVLNAVQAEVLSEELMRFLRSNEEVMQIDSTHPLLTEI